ncbi:SusC/RagA family TonB-linked outer membrane protein [Pedobacter sp. HMF7647]|uniref:SusC/RagA family TonB-linked outer membrane protein n=1 Tax=Hufsiella arboris TaxID=2695275 RepID=A0A7K1YB97_9SPHI|nr:SusC/RagA family TonB-linked outer membrane protein [Hufsiella arboris]MXV51867.1 SusC/RagA family TonB-linked outer membrane protein [Hufsiella arboris]
MNFKSLQKSKKGNPWRHGVLAVLLVGTMCPVDRIYAAMPAHNLFTAAKQTAIRGKVTDELGAPIQGVSVKIKGSTTGVITDVNGIYNLNANGNAILVFSAVGFETTEVQVNNRSTVNIQLAGSTKQLTEVVVTALGVKKQARAVGTSTTTVDGSKFTQSRETNLANALTGQVAGVSVSGTSTGPSGSGRVTIRGNSSLTANNQPLYVLDGIPVSNSNAGSSGQWGGADYGDVLSTINPDNIQNITVLKSAAASALYGYRGANGAILITTKSGQGSKGIGIDLNSNTTFSNVDDQRDYQYAYGQGSQGIKPANANAALGTSTFSWGSKLDGSQAVNFLGDNYAYIAQKNNFKNFYETGINNQSTVAFSGNADLGNFRLSLMNNYMKNPIPNSNLKQQGLNLNSTININKKLTTTVTADYIFETVKNRASFSDAPGNVLAGPLYLANSFDIRLLENYKTATGSEILPGADTYFNNPYFVAYAYQNSTKRSRLTGGVTLKYEITNWLTAQGQVTRDGNTLDLVNVLPSGTGYQPGGSLTQYTDTYRELNYGGSLDFNKKFGEFSTKLLLGGNSQDDLTSRNGIVGASPFIVPGFYTPSNISRKPLEYQYTHLRVNSLFASADLGYKNWLFLTLTGRQDWYSTLAINSNTIFYPSAAASFVFSDAFKLPDFISFGKLRASTARSSKGADPYLNVLTYGLQGYTINDQTVGYITQNAVPNPNLKPVKISEKEIGLNMDFFDSRVGFDVAFYDKTTKDDILPVTISPTSGYTGRNINIGEMQNRGFELLLNATPLKFGSFVWNTSFNIGINNNKVIALAPGQDAIVVDGAFPRWGNGVSIQQVVGKPYAQIVGYAYKRNEGGQIIYDADGLPERSNLPVPLGSGVYKTTGGFSNDFKFKSFSASILFDFKYGAKIYSGTNLLLYNDGLQQKTLGGREGGYVGPGVNEAGQPNTVAVPAQTYWQAISAQDDHHVTEEFVYDASFIKLRSASIGYSLPASVLGKSPVKGLTISLIGRNLATIMKHTPNIDPESNLTGGNGQGLELTGYPYIRSLGFNLNVKF